MANVNFVVLTSARTGSTWLMDRLNRQPGVEAHGEVFLRHARLTPAIAGLTESRRFVETHGRPTFTRLPRIFSYLNELYRAPRTVGFKLMYKQLRNYPEILAYLAVNRVRIVHLIRSNQLDVVVSEELARLTGVSHTQARSLTAVPMVHIDPETIVNRLTKLQEKPKKVRQLIRPFTYPMLEVTYEALLDDGNAFEQVLNYLGVQASQTEAGSILVKRGVLSHRESIANYDEIKHRLSSSPFAHFVR
jgi:LPS sulfotransferase NodH